MTSTFYQYQRLYLQAHIVIEELAKLTSKKEFEQAKKYLESVKDVIVAAYGKRAYESYEIKINQALNIPIDKTKIF